MNCFHFKRSILTPLQESLWLFTAAVAFLLTWHRYKAWL